MEETKKNVSSPQVERRQDTYVGHILHILVCMWEEEDRKKILPVANAMRIIRKKRNIYKALAAAELG